MSDEHKEGTTVPKPGTSAVPCGCDPGAKHRCERHQREYEEMIEEALRMNF